MSPHFDIRSQGSTSQKNRDVKFIIYQVLYIFVIAVIALKGAKLDLNEVVNKKDVNEKKYVDSLKITIDSLMARGIIPEIKFDTSQRITDPEELKRKLAEAQTKLIELKSMTPSLTVTQTQPNIQLNPQLQKENPVDKEIEETKEPKEIKKEVEFRIPQSFTQYTTNTVSNSNAESIEIIGSDGSVIASVPPGGSRTFQLGGQSSLTFRSGSATRTVTTKPNGKPKISMDRLVPAGEDVSVRSLQTTTGYRITISDDFPGQLDVNFNGPVKINQSGPLTYDVTLNFLGSKSAFDNFTENRDSPYSVTFQINIKDKLAQHTVTQSGVFQFGEW